jgi:hypothetical protein
MGGKGRNRFRRNNQNPASRHGRPSIFRSDGGFLSWTRFGFEKPGLPSWTQVADVKEPPKTPATPTPPTDYFSLGMTDRRDNLDTLLNHHSPNHMKCRRCLSDYDLVLACQCGNVCRSCRPKLERLLAHDCGLPPKPRKGFTA